LFSVAAMVRVPYFASILPHVVRMEPGFAEVTVPITHRWIPKSMSVQYLEKATTSLRARTRLDLLGDDFGALTVAQRACARRSHSDS
jgi:hypothetical protein